MTITARQIIMAFYVLGLATAWGWWIYWIVWTAMSPEADVSANGPLIVGVIIPLLGGTAPLVVEIVLAVQRLWNKNPSITIGRRGGVPKAEVVDG